MLQRLGLVSDGVWASHSEMLREHLGGHGLQTYQMVSNCAGTIRPAHMRRWVLDLSRTLRTADQVSSTTTSNLVRTGVTVGRLLRQHLGEDPAAWELAFELMDTPGTSIQDAVAAASAAHGVPGEPAPMRVPGRAWRRRRPHVVLYDGSPLYGPHNGWGELDSAPL